MWQEKSNWTRDKKPKLPLVKMNIDLLSASNLHFFFQAEAGIKAAFMQIIIKKKVDYDD